MLADARDFGGVAFLSYGGMRAPTIGRMAALF
jgi:hypothetical protein